MTHPEYMRIRARELRLQGWGYSEIADELGVSSRCVRNWAPDPLTPEQQTRQAERKSRRTKVTKRAVRPVPDPIPGVLWVYYRGEWVQTLVDLDDWHGLRDYRWTIAGGKGYAEKGYSEGKGYVVTSIKNRREYLHRMLFGLTPGARWPNGERIVIDHLNRNTLDNRRANLHVGTQKENCANRGGIFAKDLRAA